VLTCVVSLLLMWFVYRGLSEVMMRGQNVNFLIINAARCM